MNNSAPAAPEPIAIIGIGCLFPKADNLSQFWSNIKNRVDAITDVPPSHWKPEDYLHSDPKAPDRTYAARGGFLSPVDFSPLDYGIAPNALEATDTSQLLGMVVARQALADAGYGSERGFNRDRVSVILGVTGTLELVIPLGARLGHPIWRRALKEAGVPDDVATDVVERIGESYVGWQENSFPGLLGNVVAGRIANRLDLGGTNCVVDAACASSLSAVHLAMLELQAARADMVLTGGVDTFNDIFMYMCFSKTPALSATGNAKPFDMSGDGTILGEGLGMLVLKRLADAEREGDHIYAVIRGLGSSSDGKGNAIYAPRAGGQVKALREAYRQAGVTPDTIGLVEAHGTGTKAGDATEVAALTEVYQAGQVDSQWCALGSIKSQIGHTKAAAGAAGLIKAALALDRRVLPPTIKVKEPLEPLAVDQTPFYVNTEKRPWLATNDTPRRAAVSSFGFGGSNFHCVLEEYRGAKPAIDWDGSVEIVARSANSNSELRTALDRLTEAKTWNDWRATAAESRRTFRRSDPCRLLFVVERDKSAWARLIDNARSVLTKGEASKSQSHPDGIYLGRGPASGKLGVIFPGQGSQYAGMLRDLACQFPDVLDALTQAENAFGRALTDFIYPKLAFTEADRQRNEQRLRLTDVAQPAIGALSYGAWRVLERFGVQVDAVAGHSFGELTALCASGRLTAGDLFALAKLRGQLMAEGPGDRGAMLAVREPLAAVENVLHEERLELVIANKNAPAQCVLSGPSEVIERASKIFGERKISTHRLPVSAAFHSPLVAEVRERFRAALDEMRFAPAQLPVYANSTAEEYPTDAEQARDLLAGQLAKPVEFLREIENLYSSSVRTFLEVGPGNKITGLVRAILDGKEHEALALDASAGQRSGIVDLARTLAQLAALGHEVMLSRWEEGANPPAAVEEKKPALTVPICGANYVKPKSAKPPRKPMTQSNTQVADMNEPSPNSDELSSALPAPPVQARASGSIRIEPAAQARASSNLSQAWQMTQESLVALQKLNEQTAQLHKQFLEGQDRAQQTFRALLEQQQRLFGISAEPPAHATGEPGRMDSPITPPTSRLEMIKAENAEKAKPELAVAQLRLEPKPTPAQNDRVASVLLAVVADKTGYPVEMLNLEMALDADLGIDSIKRVEILSALQERLPEVPTVKPEHLGTLHTLWQVVNFLSANDASIPEPAKNGPPKSEHLSPVAPAKEHVAKLLLEVVAEKTGYPTEMLNIDMALDADLGIDSIKRVEILSSLREKLPYAPTVKPEHLGTMHTLSQVLEFLSAGANVAATGAVSFPHPEALAKTSAEPDRESAPTPAAASLVPLERSVLSKAALPSSSERNPIRLPLGSEIWVTNDGSDLAPAIARRLDMLGYTPRLIDVREPIDRSRPARLGGLIIVAPHRLSDTYLWDALSLLQQAAPALRSQSASLFTTVARLDGAFGIDELDADIDPTAGGLAGLAKTAGHEWPEVQCKAIDLAADFPDAGEAALAVVDEALTVGPAEVGISGTGRCTIQLTSQFLSPRQGTAPFSHGDVVVITGGARGVTAEVAVALARACAPALILLGRTPPPTPEPAWLAPLTQESEIKKALTVHANGVASPKKIGEQYRLLTAHREMARNIERMRRAGASVHYRCVDVRDAVAVRNLIRETRKQHGPVRGFIHGAGVLADRRIDEKTAEQVDLVYSTKVAGLRASLEELPAEELRVLAIFSSSTARFGRTGQVDYAMANEVLNKIAEQESRRRLGCRVVAVNWGPWDGGMVTPSLKKMFDGEGVGIIPLDAGADYLVQELSAAEKPPAEVVILGRNAKVVGRPGDEGFIGTREATNSVTLSPPQLVTPSTLELVLERQVDVEQMPVLESHVLNGRPVMPMSLILEWLAHAAAHGNPGLTFHGFNESRILKGVVFDDGLPMKLRLYAGKAVKREALYAVPVELRSAADGVERLRARAQILLGSKLPQEKGSLPRPASRPLAIDMKTVYDSYLFHGLDLQGIRRIEHCSDGGIAATVAAAPPPSTWCKQPLRTFWFADPLAIDCAFQLMIVWSMENRGCGSLPCAAGRYRQYRRAFPRDAIQIVIQITEDLGQRILAQMEFLDSSGELIARLEDYECVLDAALEKAFRRNRLSQETITSA